MIKNKLNKKKRKLKNILLRSFLVISIICCVFLVSNCDQLFDLFGPGNGGVLTHHPDFSSVAGTGFATELFKEVAKGAAGQIGGSVASWGLSAIGLSDESPDYTAQLDKINQSLQVIINELNGIQKELQEIKSKLDIINCSGWATQLSDEKSIVDNYIIDYQDFISTVSTGGKVPNDKILDWVDQVLAIGNYSGNTSMGIVLTKFSSTLIGPANTGVLPSCIQTISNPAENSFGTDTVYYKQVKLFTEYYLDYQVRALFLYTEAKHYQAWMAAGSPNSDYLSADSVAGVCSNIDAKLYCNNAAGRTNSLYNSLINQFRIGGAPYSDSHLVLMYSQENSYLLPLSLEDFTTAAGDNCEEPLTSADPCGITAGFYDVPSMQGVTYRGYAGWLKTGTAIMTHMLAGWTSGTAGNYLEQKLGFKNMKNKIIISSNVEIISLNETGNNQYVIPFFDTDWDYNFLPGGGGPAITEIQFRQGPLVKNRKGGAACGGQFRYFINVDYYTNSNVPSNRNDFYNAHGHARYCLGGDNYATPFSFSVIPGYVALQDGARNHQNSARQYRWPAAPIKNFSCTGNYSNRNVGGVWSMCGDDFTAFLDSYIPRPETCDYTGAGVQCSTTSQAVANAHMEFGSNTKSNGSF